MTAHLPPVPPAQRSGKGPGEPAEATDDTTQAGAGTSNTAEQGGPGNVHQNTTNKGHQQDR